MANLIVLFCLKCVVLGNIVAFYFHAKLLDSDKSGSLVSIRPSTTPSCSLTLEEYIMYNHVDFARL